MNGRSWNTHWRTVAATSDVWNMDMLFYKCCQHSKAKWPTLLIKILSKRFSQRLKTVNANTDFLRSFIVFLGFKTYKQLLSCRVKMQTSKGKGPHNLLKRQRKLIRAQPTEKNPFQHFNYIVRIVAHFALKLFSRQCVKNPCCHK